MATVLLDCAYRKNNKKILVFNYFTLENKSLKLFQNYIFIFFSFKTNIQKIFALLRPLRIGFRTVVKYRKIPPAAAANQIAENSRIPPAADLQKNKKSLCYLL